MEESLEARDREMLKHVHLQFRRGPGMPRSWEELPEDSKEQIRKLYRESMERRVSGELPSLHIAAHEGSPWIPKGHDIWGYTRGRLTILRAIPSLDMGYRLNASRERR